jgi:hypothetical protein
MTTEKLKSDVIAWLLKNGTYDGILGYFHKLENHYIVNDGKRYDVYMTTEKISRSFGNFEYSLVLYIYEGADKPTGSISFVEINSEMMESLYDYCYHNERTSKEITL